MQGDGKQVSLMTVASQSILYIGILESLVHFLPFNVNARYMDTFTDMYLVFFLFLQPCGLLLMVSNFGKIIEFW